MSEVTLTIDGVAVSVEEGTSLFDAAQKVGAEVPVLCHDPRLRPVGVCRMCVVEVEGERTLAASCVRTAEADMVVHTTSERVTHSRRGLTQLLSSEQPEESAREATTGDDALLALARELDVDGERHPSGARPRDDSSAVIAVDHQACILCDRCIRACNEVQHNDVLGRTGKGFETRIAFDFDQPMGESTCVSCGECAAVCPTGALVDKGVGEAPRPRAELEAVDSVCPYCGVGCAIRYHRDTANNRISFAEGRDSFASESRLCVKGRYGYDYATHAQRLTKPLIRVDYPKHGLSSEVRSSDRRHRKPGGLVDLEQVLPAFREASWDEALDLVAARLLEIKSESGSGALAGFGSAKCSNEEAYLFQKLVRAVFGTNNVDHCTRLCHASSVSALLQMIGSGAVTTTFGDIANSDFAIVTGSNTTANHPVAATFFKQAAARGAKLLVVNPIHIPLADHAWRFCQIRPGSDVAFYNGMMHVVIAEGLVDRDYVEAHTTDFERVSETVERYTPEVVSAICGIAAETIREVAIEYGRAQAAITFWGMGMSQHVHGTDNCRCIISLCLMTGNIGRPGTGLHPLRGQNNVQGASDAGLIPMSYPDYQPVINDDARQRFEAAWGAELDPATGLTTTEIISAARDGDIRGMYILGENPFLSDPNINKVREGLGNLDFLVVQDIFFTETAEFADVILPATSALEKSGTFTNTDRRVQLGRPVLTPPGEARLDWQIICDIAKRMGYDAMQYESADDVFDEFVSLSRNYRGLAHDKLGLTGKLYPCPDPDHSDGTVVMFGGGFPTADGRARFVPADHTGADELPDDEYPLILVTGRILEHWHTGVMTRRSKALSTIEPEAFASLHRRDAEPRGIVSGDWIEVRSRRGKIRLEARVEDRTQPGSIFIPFHFREAAANILTTDKLDPDGKIPEFKFCAVSVDRMSDDAG
ncbi:MAG: formate dehydrogenase subunit alpha [Myxococcota bacterium]|jgi:formate dehydrogenase major subunit|nr:formate dehydrogenase subunit alpha [Myxococcota bacterium]